ncbi:MAG: hypothetical protein CL731_06095 [Chloroflexi bacterium]|nr:hypothetical protein [Chloroflexota bacterium]
MRAVNYRGSRARLGNFYDVALWAQRHSVTYLPTNAQTKTSVRYYNDNYEGGSRRNLIGRAI